MGGWRLIERDLTFLLKISIARHPWIFVDTNLFWIFSNSTCGPYQSGRFCGLHPEFPGYGIYVPEYVRFWRTKWSL